jgi:iron(II)-dependent oxidoreductase
MAPASVVPRRSPETLPRGGVDALPESDFAARLEEARRRTLWLVEPVCDEDLDRVHDTLLSPLAWDLGHIAAFEDLWVSRASGRDPLRGDLFDVYDAEETPRSQRGDLPYLLCAEARAYLAEVHERALEELDRADLSNPADPLNAGGFVWEMLIEHEHQHNETMLQTLQIAAPGVFRPDRPPSPSGPGRRPPPEGMVHVEAGSFLMGAGPEAGFAYDNERPQHARELPTFDIDRAPVSNGAYGEFVDAGGYERREWWSEEGWAWRQARGAERPGYWMADGRVRSFERTEALAEHLPVMHVSFFEAEAYARSQGKRLPTEAEWEKAATWDPATGAKRTWPWGEASPDPARATLDQTPFGPTGAGALSAGASAYGAVDLVGDCWEWTTTHFEGYPGFRSFPYREYSETHFGQGYRVLRGGSWASRPATVRSTFRSWDLPTRRQIFVGLRCAA